MEQMYNENLKKPNVKRRLASETGCKNDLNEELPLMFKAFSEAYEAYEREVVLTPPQARARGFEASLLNSKMIQSIQKNFPKNWRFGRYKRFTLRINGYIILFKKLNNRDLPMNIKTNAVSAISQQLTIPLFDEKTYIAEPILFFGYRKNKMGNILDPKLVYIDEDKVKWAITENDITVVKTINIPQTEKVASPKLRENIVKKKSV